jgi:Na+-translocating ferredoxin:NAD+ oxidoreductase RnfD subunit
MFRVLAPQQQQVLTLIFLFVIGKQVAHVYIDWVHIVELLVVAIITEHVLILAKHHRVPYVSVSSLSTTLGMAMMMVATSVWIYVFLLVAALVQKHTWVVASRHFFNPSNFALIVGMLLFYNRAHIVLGQMGEIPWFLATVMVLALLILVRVDRWRIPVAFVASYLFFEYIWIVGYDPVATFDDIFQRFYSVSFVIFVAFMLTDPRTTPSSPHYQLIFGMVLAMLGTWMDRRFGFRVQHLFMVLFLISPWVPWIEAAPPEKQKTFWVSLTLFLLAMGAIMYIESQPPYYFEMEG